MTGENCPISEAKKGKYYFGIKIGISSYEWKQSEFLRAKFYEGFYFIFVNYVQSINNIKANLLNNKSS